MEVLLRKAPTQRRSAATVECALEAAARILEEQGLAGFNTNAVAKRAGISVGSLYQYFPAKEAITSALILRAHERIVEGMRDLLRVTEGQKFAPALDALLAMVVAGEPRSPRLARILEAEEDRLAKSPAILAAEDDIAALNRAFFARYLGSENSDGRALATIAGDVVAIVRALVDSDEPRDLTNRIKRAVTGYLAPLLADGTEQSRSRVTGNDRGRTQ